MCTVCGARGRSVGNALVLLMSRPQSKQDVYVEHLRTRRNLSWKILQRHFLISHFCLRLHRLSTPPQLVWQIITLQQTGFLNKYPECISRILSACDIFPSHSHIANKIIVWPPCPQASQKPKNIWKLRPLMLCSFTSYWFGTFWRTHVGYIRVQVNEGMIGLDLITQHNNLVCLCYVKSQYFHSSILWGKSVALSVHICIMLVNYAASWQII